MVSRGYRTVAAFAVLVSMGLGGEASSSPKGSRTRSSHTSKSTPKAASRAKATAPKAPKTAAVTPKSSRASQSATTGRTAAGRIQRSAAARHTFARQTGYPNGRPGYVIDHIVPLACGGADAPSNMQWQTIAEGKAKDKTERKGCK
jgi:hypothetical protein